ncbi:MAG TPA: hypothetical protein DIU15_07235 [Deltaproteobacteria bacterium]|nr:hypothetical protein [Deltaproteobacteria bacterium]
MGCRQRDLVTVSEAWPMHNTATERSSFAIDGLALLEMADLAAERQLSLLGPYHSHPLGPTRPSKRDQQSAERWPETLWLILDGRVTARTSWSAWWSQSGVLAPLNAEEAVLSSAVP